MDRYISRKAIDVILREHGHLTNVIDGMQQIVRRMENEGSAGCTMLLRAMLFYIREFPEQVHHPKEDKYLFARLVARTDEVAPLIDELIRQHASGARQLGELDRLITRYELDGTEAMPALRDAVQAYAQFYACHRYIEETQVLPAAQRYLMPEDWDEIDDAFGANPDPFGPSDTDRSLENLYSLIARTMPQNGLA